MSKRRRFGISISSHLADALDLIASKLGSDRSKLVEEALQPYIHDHIHLTVKHECAGLIVVAGTQETRGVASLLEDYTDIIRGHFHTHLGGLCVNILAVEGDSERILDLMNKLVKLKGCSTRYIPLKPLEAERKGGLDSG